MSLAFVNSLVSSANFDIVSVAPYSKSLMYTKNKTGLVQILVAPHSRLISN